MKVTLWVAALVAGVSCTPWQPRKKSQCSTYCKESTKIQLEPGTVYVYDYVADSVTSVQGPTKEESRIQISARVEVEAESQCELILWVQDVSLFESDSGDLVQSDGSSDFAKSLEKYPLRISYQDGVVENICATSEKPWVLNIKRGILSAMQNSMTDDSETQTLLETDIAGYCETNYTKVSSGTFRRTKNLLGCSGRHAFQHTNIKAVPYNTMSAVQSLPLLRSDHTCEQTIRNQRIQTTTCRETHTFRPFSSETSGAQTRITQTLVYKKQGAPEHQFPDDKLSKTSLVYDPSATQPTEGGKEEVVVALLKALVKNSEGGLTSEVPSLFGGLITQLKPMMYAEISKVYHNTDDLKARKFLIDALPNVGTASSFAMLRDLIRDGALTESEQDVWLTSLAFQTRPSIQMIEAVAPLLQEAKPSKSALLGISSLVHHYCTSVDCNGSSEHVVQKIIRYFEQQLGSGCRALDDNNKDAILVALKALGNAGLAVNSAETLKRCFQESNPMEIRLSAIAAARRFNCDFDRSNLMTMFREVTADSELRIAAYLAIMKCPSQKVLDEVKEALQREPVNQVGSFVWTHLTNLQESADPNKQAVKQLLEDEFFKNKFNTDVRKFSRNFEFSSFWEELNIGGTVDSNIIFSTQSYVPRSAMLNLTLDLFGESVNLLEVGGRVEGLEPLIEQFFGPGGYFPDDTLEKVLKSFRGKREVDTSALNQLIGSFDGKYGAELEGSVFMKVFGNELHHSSFKGFCTAADCSLFKKLDIGSTLDAIVALLRESNVEYSKTFQFLDVATSVPTAIGLPLTLSANGTSTISLTMKGKVSVKNWRLFDIGGTLSPSAVVEINSVMSVDAGMIKSGIKVRNMMRTATSVDGKVEINGNELVSVKLNTPKDKVEVLEVTSDVFMISKGKHIRPRVDTVDKKVCSSELLGMSVCGELQYPKGEIGLPLGPARASLYVEKTDSHTGYQFDYKWTNEIVKKQTIRTIMVTFDMPSSKYDRRLATKLVVDEPGRALRFSLQSPITKLDATGKYVFTGPLKSTDVIINVDGEEFATLKAALRSDLKISSGRFEPIVIVTQRGAEVFNLKGAVNYVTDSKYGVDLTLTQVTTEPIRITGDLINDNGKYDVAASLRSFIIDSSIKGTVKVADNVFNTKMSVDYSLMKAAQQRVDVAGKWSSLTKGSLLKYSLNWNLMSTEFPIANSEISWELQSSPNYVENEGKIAVAGENWSMHQLYSKQKTGSENSFQVKLALQCEKRDVDYHASYSRIESDKLFSHKMKFRSSEDNQYTSIIEFQSESGKDSVRIEGSCPYSSAYFRGEVTEAAMNIWEVNAEGKWGEQKETRLAAKISNLDTYEEMKKLFQADLKSPLFDDVKFSAEFQTSQTKSTVLANFQRGEKTYDITVGHTFDGEDHTVLCKITAPEMKPVVINSTVTIRMSEKAISVVIQSEDTIKFNGKYKRDAQEFLLSSELSWNAKNLKVAAFKISFTEDKFDTLVKYPGREVTLVIFSTPLETSGTLSWSPKGVIVVNIDHKMDGAVKKIRGQVQTPFLGYEVIEVASVHQQGDDSLGFEVTGKWSSTEAGITVSALHSDERVQGTVSLRSNIQDFKEMSTGFIFINNENQKQITLTATIGDKTTELRGGLANVGSYKLKAYAGDMVLTTPYSEPITIEFDFSREAGKLQTTAGAKVGENQIIRAQLEGQSTEGISGSVKINSQARGYEELAAGLSYASNKGDVTIKLQGALNEQEVKIEASGGKSWNRRNTAYKMALNVETPFTPTLTTNFAYVDENRKITSSGDLSLDGVSQAKFSINGTLLSIGKFDLTSSAKFFEHDLSSKLINDVDGSKVSTSLDATLDGAKYQFSMSGDNQSDRKTRAFYGKFKINTPSLPDVSFVTDFSKKLTSMSASAKLSYATATYAVTSKLGAKDSLNFEGALELQSPQLSTKVKSIQSWNGKKFSHESLLSNLGKSLIFSSSGDVRQDKDNLQVSGTGTLSTPWSEDVNLTFSHKQKDGELLPEVTVSYGKSKEVKVATVLTRSNNGLSVNVNIAPNFCDAVIFAANYDVKNQQKTAAVSFEWQKNRKIVVDLKGAFDKLATDARVSIKTPLDGFKVIGVSVNYDLLAAEKKLTVLASVDSQKAELKAKATATGAKASADVSLVTPIPSLELVSANAVVDFKAKQAELSVKVANQEIKCLANLLQVGNKGKATVKYSNPFTETKSVSVEMNYDSSSDKKVQIVFETDKSRSDLQAKLTYSASAGAVEIVVNTPVKDFELMSVKAAYELAKRSLLFSTRKNSAEINFEASNPAGILQIALTTPFEIASDISLTAKYTPKSIETVLSHNSEKCSLVAAYEYKQNSLEASGSLTTPFEVIDQVNASFKYDWKNVDRTVKLDLARASDVIAFNGTFNIQDMKTPSATFTLLTPFQSSAFETLVKYDVKSVEKSAEIKVNSGMALYHGLFSVAAQPRSGRVSAYTELPIGGYESLRAEGSYDLTSAPGTIKVAVDKNSENVMSVEVEADLIHVSAKASTMFIGYEEINFQSAIRRDDRFEVSISANKNDVKISTKFAILDDEFELQVGTPFSAWESLAFKTKYEFDAEQKMFHVEASRNGEKASAGIEGVFGLKKTDMVVEVTSSVTEKLSLAVKYDFVDTISGAISLEKNGKKKAISGDLDITPTEAKVHIHTPFRGYRDVQISTKLNKGKAELVLQLENNRSAFSASLNFDKDATTASLRTPFRGFEELDSTLRYDVTGQKKLVTLTLMKNNERIDFSGNAVVKSNIVTIDSHFSSSISGFERIDLSVNYERAAGKTQTSVLYNRNTVKYEAALTAIDSDSTIEVAAQLSSPIRRWERVSIDGTIRKRDKKAIFTVEINGERHEISGTLDVNATSFKATLETPFKGYETISVAAKYDDFSLEAGLHTPFRGFETLSVSGDYDFQSESKMARITLIKGINTYENIVRAKLTSMEGAISSQSSLPISGYENMALDFVYDFDLRDYNFGIVANAQKGLDRIEGSVQAKVGEKSADFTTRFATPFRSYEDVEVSLKYDLGGAGKKAGLTLDVKGESILNLSGTFTLGKLRSDLALTILIPIVSESKTELTFKHDMDSKTVELTGLIKDTTFSISGRMSNARSGNLKISSNSQTLSNIEAAWKINNSRVEVDLNLGEDRNVRVAADLKINSVRDITIRGTLDTFFAKRQEMRVEVNAKPEKSYATLNYKNGDVVFNLDANTVTTGEVWQLESTIRTPVRGLEAISVLARYGKESAKAEANFSGQKVEIEANFDLRKLRSSSQVKITTPFTEAVEISYEYDVASKEKTGQAVFSYGDKRVRLNGVANMKSATEAEARIQLTSNTSIDYTANIRYNFVETVKTAFAEFKTTGKTTSVEATISTENMKPSVTLNLITPVADYKTIRVAANANFKRGTVVQFTTRGISDIDVSFSANQSNIRASLATPFDGFKNLRFECDYSFGSTEKVLHANLTNDDDLIVISFSANNGRVNMKLEGPFESFRVLQLDGVIPTGSNKRGELSLTRDGESMSLVGTVLTGVEKGVKFQFTSPSSSNTELLISYDIESDTKKAEAVLRMPDNEIRIVLVGQLEPIRKTSLTLEMRNFDPITIELNVDQSSVRLGAGFDGKRVEFESAYVMTKDQSSLSASLSLPVEGFEQLSFSAQTKKDTVEISLDYAQGKTIQFTGSSKNGSGFSVAGTLQTPFETVKHLSGELYFELSEKAKGGKLSAQWNDYSKLTVSGLVKADKLEISLETPFEKVRDFNMILGFQYSGVTNNFSASAEVQGSRIAIEGAFDNTGVTAKISTNEKTISLSARFQLAPSVLTASLKLSTPFKNFENFVFDFDASIDESNATAKLSVETPFKKLPSGNFELKYRNVNEKIETSFNSALLGQTADIKATFDLSGLSAELSSDISCCPSLDGLRISAHIEKPRDTLYRIELRVRGKQIDNSFSGEYEYSMTTLSLKGKINSDTLSKPVYANARVNLTKDYKGGEVFVDVMSNTLNIKYVITDVSLQIDTEAMLAVLGLETTKLNLHVSYNEARVSLSTPKTNHSLSATFENRENKFSGSLELDTPLLDTKKNLRFTGALPEGGYSPISIDATVEGREVHTVSAAFDIRDKLKITGRSNSPYTGEVDLELSAGSLDGIITIETRETTHKARYQVIKSGSYEIEIDAESPYIPDDRIFARAALKKNSNVLEATLSTQTGSGSHTFSGELRTEADSLLFRLKAETSFLNLDVASIELRANRGRRTEAVFALDLYRNVHKMAVSFQKDQIEAEFKAESPFIRDGSIAASLTSKYDPSGEASAEVELSCGSSSIRLDGAATYGTWKDMQLSANLNTPFEALTQARFTTHFKTGSGLNAGIEIQSSLESFPQAGILIKYEPTDSSYDASITVKTPIENYENMSLLLNVPISSASVEPRLTAIFQNQQYTIYGVFKFLDERIELTAVAEGAGKKIGASVIVKTADIYEVRIDAFTPIQGYEKFSWDLRGQLDLKNWADSTTFIDWDGKRIELTTSGRAEDGAFSTKFELKTPFSEYEKFAVTIRVEKTERKTLQLELEYPGKQFGINFDYLFNSLTDFILKASVKTPMISFDKLTIELSNRISSNSYSGTVEGRIFSYGFGLNIEGDLRPNTAEGSIEARLNDKVISLKVNSGIGDKSFDASVTLSTPFQRIHSFDANVHLEKNVNNMDNVVAANLNGKNLFTAVVLNKEGGRNIELTNPIYPISLTYSVEKVNSSNKLVAEFCWNIHKRTTSTIGIEATFNLGSKKSLIGKAILPTRVLGLSFNLENTETKLDNAFNLSWKEGQSFGYKIVVEAQNTRSRVQTDAVLRVDFPTRSFESEYHSAATRSEYSVATDFKWDAARDASRSMGVVFESADKSRWGTTSKAYLIRLNHFKLPHDLIFKAEYRIAAPTDVLLASSSFQYSEFDNELLIVQIAINDESADGEKNYKALVSAQHVVSNIDFKATGDIYCQSSKVGGRVRADYRDISGVQKFIDVSTKFDKDRNKLAIGANTADQSLAILGGIKKDADHYTAALQTSVNNESPVKVEVNIDLKKPSLKVHLHASEKTVKLYAGFPTKKEIRGKISHDFFGKTVVDSFFSLKLNTSKILSNRIYWRSEALQEFKDSSASYFNGLSSAVGNTKDTINDFVTEERAHKLVLLRTTLRNIYDTYAIGYIEEINAIKSDFAGVIKAAQKMYERDDFFAKSIVQLAVQVQAKFAQASAKTVSNISCVFSSAADGIKRSAVFFGEVAFNVYSKATTLLPIQFLKDLKLRTVEAVIFITNNFATIASDIRTLSENMIESIKSNIQMYSGNFELAVMREIEVIEERIVNIVRAYVDASYSYVHRFKHVYDWTKDKCDMIVGMTEDFKTELRNRIVNYPLLHKISKLYKTYYAWLEEVHFQEFVEYIANEFRGTIQSYSEKFDAVTSKYQPYIKATIQAIKGQYELVKQLPPVAYFSTLIDRAFVEAQKLWSLVEMKNKLVADLRNALQRLDKLMNTLSEDLKGAAADIDFNNVLDFGSSSGKFEATLNLPMEWDSLKELPNFKTMPSYKRYELSVNSLLDYLDFSDHHYHFIDTVARFRPEIVLKNVVPPFGSHALIAGNQHYMTFDRKYFEFAGECSYLLVHDYTDGNFSVLANYDGASGKFIKKSLTVLSNGKQLEITSSKVVVDGKRVEVPYQDEDLAVYIDGSRITVETPRGGRVECNLFRDTCTVHITGWSFGKTAGLFGVYNYEPSDDFTTPKKELRSDSEIESFAHSWQVGTSRCRVKNTATLAKTEDPKANIICSEMFNDPNSFLRPCFNLVDVEPYKKMCLNDLSGLTNSAKQDLGSCTAATAYAMECRLHGVDMWVPTKCVRCNLDDGNVLLAAENKAFNSSNPPPKSADIVFLVEQKKCLKNSRINTIPQEMDVAMKEKGYSNNRYAVVTFGGKGVFENPHIRTSDSEPWNNRKAIKKAFDGLNYDGEEATDAIKVIKYAASLSFRAGVSKHLVLVSCESTCHSSDYGDAVTLLLENDFKLHIIRPEKLKMRGKSEPKVLSSIYGYDAVNVFTPSGALRVLRKHVQVPKDSCTPLALETNGTVFDLNKIVGEKAQSPKRVIDAFAKRFALTAGAAPCQRCDCIGDKDGVGTMECQRCISPAIERFLKDWASVAYESELENIALENFPLTDIRIKPEDPARPPRKN